MINLTDIKYLRQLKDAAINVSDNYLDLTWTRAYLKLADVLDMIDAMHCRRILKEKEEKEKANL